jgi:hypothetical protein
MSTYSVDPVSGAVLIAQTSIDSYLEVNGTGT